MPVETITGITLPYQEVSLGPVAKGRIARVAVSEGQTVRKGDLLAGLDDGVQQARTVIAKIRAENNVEVQLAETRKRAAEIDLDHVSGLHKKNAASKKELQDTEVMAELRALEREQAKLEHELAVETYRLEQLRLEDMRVYAPFNGYVVELIKRVGETVDELESVIKLAQLHPLTVAIDCPMQLAHRVRLGDTAVVKPDDARWPTREGKVTLTSRVGDAGSQTFKVKLTVPNEDLGWISGLRVRVEFQGSEAKAATTRPSKPEGDASARQRTASDARRARVARDTQERFDVR